MAGSVRIVGKVRIRYVTPDATLTRLIWPTKG